MKNMVKDLWPELSYQKGKDTYRTIHLWSQIVGKIKLAQMPWINHSWHVTFFVTPVGLTTGDIPAGEKHFQITFDFLNHQLEVITNLNEVIKFELHKLSVSSCYNKVLSSLKELGIEIKINPIPNELADPTPLNEDHSGTYEPETASALHLALLKSNEVFTAFRGRFSGKCSPVHFFWGGLDLAVSRFSGRKAPKHPGGIPNLPDWVAQEAYSEEVCSCGFWPGNESFPEAAFYTYIYPEPEGFSETRVKPAEAYYHSELSEFILPYTAVQKADTPSETLMDFLQSTFDAAAGIADWDREKLEKINEKWS